MQHAGIVLTIPQSLDLTEVRSWLETRIEWFSDINIASLRIEIGGHDRAHLLKRADYIREIGHKNDISVIVDDMIGLVEETGLDGVHLSAAKPQTLREARKKLGADAIIGVFAGASRHDGLVMGEIGVDYVSFGPVVDNGRELPLAPIELFEWWSDMIELPVIATGLFDSKQAASILPFVDFIELGHELLGETAEEFAKSMIEALQNSAA